MIATKRLNLEPIRVAHAIEMFSGLTDKQLYTFLPEDPPKSLDALQSRYRKLETAQCPDGKEIWLNWIIYTRSNREAIGYVQATVNESGTSQIAYVLFSKHWRNGFAYEAVAAAIQSVFDHYATPMIEALIDTRNRASQGLVSKLGFNLSETIKEADFFKGSSSDEYRYVMSRRTWMRSKSDER